MKKVKNWILGASAIIVAFEAGRKYELLKVFSYLCNKEKEQNKTES